jgi:hypothetical protein
VLLFALVQISTPSPPSLRSGGSFVLFPSLPFLSLPLNTEFKVENTRDPRVAEFKTRVNFAWNLP